MEQATVEPVETTTITANPQRKGFFTKENARHYHALAVEARKQAAIEREQAAAKVAEIAALPTDEAYRLKSLARTRELIQKLEEELDSCSNPQAGHYLVSSIAKLRDAEQKLAMRPLPGSHRPSKSPTPKPHSIEPSE